MKIKVTAHEIYVWNEDKGGKVLVPHGETVDVPDAVGEKFIAQGVAVNPDAAEAEKPADDKPAAAKPVLADKPADAPK
jgi:hypothetical protein